MRKFSKVATAIAVALVSTVVVVPPSTAQASTAAFTESWQSPSSPLFRMLGQSPASAGVANGGTSDGAALRLQLKAFPDPGPNGGSIAQTKDTYLYGTFMSSVKSADCSAQPRAGVVTGQQFTMSDDRTAVDGDGDGIRDHSEIDFETLCAEPEVLYLTIWTDYEEGKEQRRVMRSIDMRTGQVLSTCSYIAFGGVCQPLSGAEAWPAQVPAVPGFDSSTVFHEYGFTWTPTSVTFWITVGGTTITLWHYQGPSDRIPHTESSFMHSVWHTDGWSPPGDQGAVEQPRTPVSGWVDWSRYTPL